MDNAMSSYRKFYMALFLAAIQTLLVAPMAPAEEVAQEPAAQSQPQAAPTPKKAAADPKDGWHFAVTPYLWFAEMHGTVGANGHDVSVHAGFGDIFSYLNIGLMGAGVARYKKFGAPVDFLWMKLSDDKSLPFERGPSSVKAKITQTLFAPKVSYHLVDGEMVKVDGNFGIRYFHLGTTLDFVGTGPQPSFHQSANWVDYTAGARVVAALSRKTLVTVLGDAGAGGVNLDYQVGGALDTSSSRTSSCRRATATWTWITVQRQALSTTQPPAAC